MWGELNRKCLRSFCLVSRERQVLEIGDVVLYPQTNPPQRLFATFLVEYDTLTLLRGDQYVDSIMHRSR